ncbi:chorismate mutase [Allofrancisella frigidaquae]|uniref:chorismate mutase n=1 Tax=Allofrancisella frigidaquae TaxID=1085644 RepID=A0A6M3HTF5_9GAMM|nr:chorismate mutase [Allofrancisella frigidaquae]KEI35930.1 hypothetical protein FRA_26c02440 [Francisella sp. W12-1067]QIV94513.1 chorismate mutase [Allofrancisella frigidaquae]
MKKTITILIVGIICWGSVSAMGKHNTPSLDQYRTKITNIDQEIIRLIAQREQIVKQVGKYKKKHNLAVYDPDREAKLKKTHEAIAMQYDVSPELVNNVFDVIISNSRDLEKKV